MGKLQVARTMHERNSKKKRKQTEKHKQKRNTRIRAAKSEKAAS